MTNNRDFVFVISLIVKFHQAVVIDRTKSPVLKQSIKKCIVLKYNITRFIEV